MGVDASLISLLEVGLVISDRLIMRASKAGVVGLTKTAARENARKGITCNVICPGFIETDMTLKLKEINDGAAWESMMQRIPAGYAGKPEDVGNMVAFLASEEASVYYFGSHQCGRRHDCVEITMHTRYLKRDIMIERENIWNEWVTKKASPVE